MNIRPLTPADAAPILTVLDAWWGGRPMRAKLPRLFFDHFNTTSFAVEHADNIIGFVIGFFSPGHPDEAYIHFVGVHPAYRTSGLGRRLYERFFEAMRGGGRHIARCVTSPVNITSIAFHKHMGFTPEPSQTVTTGGVPYIANYDGPDEHRVLFTKTI